MRENRTYGSEGGATQLNALFLPLSNNIFLAKQSLSLRVGDPLWIDSSLKSETLRMSTLTPFSGHDEGR
jgi:hypothetical protein